MRKPFLGGNWKMNADIEAAHALASACHKYVQSSRLEMVLFPSFVYLSDLQFLLTGGYCRLGAQDVSEFDKGAYTGEVAAYMLHDFDCAYVLVGHSERRHIYKETNSTVAAKYQQAWQACVQPILCVGETLQQKQANQVEAVITEQLQAVIEQSGIDSFQDSVIAYEPVWAIGTGEVATEEAINNAHQLIRQYLSSHSQTVAESVRIIYGGSLKPSNAHSIFNLPEVDGGLAGGAALKSDDFLSLYDELVQTYRA